MPEAREGGDADAYDFAAAISRDETSRYTPTLILEDMHIGIRDEGAYTP